MLLLPCVHAVFRTILKTNNLAAGDFPEIQAFASKLNEVKFSDFASFSQKQIDELDQVLNVEIPKLMAVRWLHLGCLANVYCAKAHFVPSYFVGSDASERERLPRVAPCQDARRAEQCQRAHSIYRRQIRHESYFEREQPIRLRRD